MITRLGQARKKSGGHVRQKVMITRLSRDGSVEHYGTCTFPVTQTVTPGWADAAATIAWDF